MRRILVDHARKKAAIRRGGDLARVTFHDLDIACEDADLDLLALDEALTELDKVDQRLGAVIRYRYFASLTVEETAELLAVSSATVKRDWAYARAWVLERISRSEESRA